MKYRAVIADVDGTLVMPGEYPAKKPSKKLISAVNATRERGVVFSLASARSLFGVQKLIDYLNMDSLIILDNGAKIYDCGKKKYVWESYLESGDAKKTISYLSQDKSLRIIIVDDDKRLEDISKVTKWKISKIVILNITPGKAEELYQTLRMIPSVHVTKSISSDDPPMESIHVTSINATKQMALYKFAEMLSIDPKEIIGIGDSYNDFPFLLACGLKVAMKNATDDIIAIADYIAPSYKNDGVAEVINKFILLNK